MHRIPSFVYGHVIAALITGVVGGAFLDLTALLAFGSGLLGVLSTPDHQRPAQTGPFSYFPSE